MERALALDPNDADAWATYTDICAVRGKVAVPLDAIHRAFRLEPLTHPSSSGSKVSSFTWAETTKAPSARRSAPKSSARHHTASLLPHSKNSAGSRTRGARPFCTCKALLASASVAGLRCTPTVDLRRWNTSPKAAVWRDYPSDARESRLRVGAPATAPCAAQGMTRRVHAECAVDRRIPANSLQERR